MKTKRAKLDVVEDTADEPVPEPPKPPEPEPEPEVIPEPALSDLPESLDDGLEASPEPKPASPTGARRQVPVQRRLVTRPADPVAIEQERDLRALLSGLAQGGGFRVAVTRVEPTEFRDPATGQFVSTGGLLRTYDEIIDDEFISKRHGGGKYSCRILRADQSGSFRFYKHVTIKVAGDPRTDDVNRTVTTTAAPVVPAAQTGESPSVAAKALDMMSQQLARMSDERKPDKTIDPALMMVMEQMREDGRRRDAESARREEALERQLSELRTQLAVASKPTEDPFKDKLLSSMVDGESGRILTVRAQHESEVRMMREQAQANERAIRDGHQRELDKLEASFQREILALKHSNEVALQAVSTAAQTQASLLTSDRDRLLRENDHLRDEIKELRQRKDKSTIETLHEMKKLKEMFEDDEGGGGDKSALDKFMEHAPSVGEFIARAVSKAPQGPQVAAQTPTAPARPVVAKDQDGNRFVITPDGIRAPVKRKPKVIPAQMSPDGTVIVPELVLPEVDADTMKRVIGMLQAAYDGNQEPETVAMTFRDHIPDSIKGWIRDHDSDSQSGVDLFMSKVAKLPNTSTLSGQRGRTWLRKVGKALIQ